VREDAIEFRRQVRHVCDAAEIFVETADSDDNWTIPEKAVAVTIS